ncbi:MAG: hypothetical protein WAU24_07320 [Chitinophagaceae bacterium]
MTITDYQDGKIIILSKAFDNRAKFLNIIYFLMFTISAFFFGSLYIESMSGSFLLGIISLTAFIAFLYGGYKFLNKALQTEKLIVNKKTLTIIKKGFLSNQNNTYDNALISKFRHLDKPEITNHPLAGQTFDYLGFQTEQAVINEMHGDKRLAFDYNGKTITFGENVYTWDFEELEVLLYDITGNDFRYTDKFEKDFDLTDESQQEKE